MYILIISIATISVIAYWFLESERFGKMPKGLRLERIKNSENYKNGAFQNKSFTPDLTEGANYYSVLKEFIFSDKQRNKPTNIIPNTKTDLHNLDSEKDLLVWFGHSSYFIQLDGKKILVDPVFSKTASPFSFTTKSFKGSNQYTADDIPEIDFVFITHDHWDHLDYRTMKALQPKIGQVICGLGTGEHLERWGFRSNQIIEKDWHENFALTDGFSVTTVPARHFSGRGLKRNQSLWLSFALKTPTMNIYIGGDSGYDTHFEEAGKKLGPFDIAILENGQYDKSWKYIHMQPEEVVKAAEDLKASKLFPVHSSKFALANHDWDEPLERISKLNEKTDLQLLTPIIGEVVHLKKQQKFSKWWEFTN
ncbi:MBL fold metallo-hydrolase [Flavobacterium sp.]|uniref:MBL fold metallo-hydrolase n=1 Tax=Flavobacterium sp. TaxID=239 RepID=UPI0028BDEE6D|nr:MBL fold metallo-hydrolase [Flavobacterium sp.]